MDTIQVWCYVSTAVIITLLAGCSSPTGSAIAKTADPIKIGLIGPLTGDASVFGISDERAARIGIDEMNEAGGIDGRPIILIAEDGRCNGKDAVTAAKKLIEVDKVKILLVCCSAEVLAVAPMAEEAGVLVLTVATTPAVSSAGDMIFRVSYKDTDVARLAADLIGKDHDSVGIIYEQTSYPEGLKEDFIESFKSGGGYTYIEGFAQGSQDVRTQVSKLLAREPDAIFVDPDTPATGLAVLKELKVQGFKGGLYGNYFGSDKAVIESPDAQGLIFISDPALPDNHLKRGFLDEYRRKYGDSPSFEFWAGARYDSVSILHLALLKVGDDPSKIRDCLYAMPDFTGILGTYHFDENGDAVGEDAKGLVPALKMIKDREVVPYESG